VVRVHVYEIWHDLGDAQMNRGFSWLRFLASRGFEFRQMLRRSDQSVPIGVNVLRRPAYLSHNLGHLLGRHHFNGIPRAHLQIVRVRFLARYVYANFAAHAAFQIDFAKALEILKMVVLLNFQDAIDWANLQARLAAGAIIGIDYSQFLGQLFTGALLCHRC